MTYSSLLFIYIFFPAALGIYLITPKKFKELLLYAESLVFCGFMGIRVLLFMLLYSIVNYTAGLLIYQVKPKVKCVPLAAGILFDALMLISFRAEYFSYLHDFIKLPEGTDIAGISIFTLSAIGYLADIYKGSIRADRNFIRLSLYIMMFPRLIMGTIVSYDTFAHTGRNLHINMAEIGSGLTGFIKGAAKKVIIADQLFALYSAVKATALSELSAAAAWLGCMAYLLCFYFTLSGLSDMSVGLCRCFGYRFPHSFNYPLFSPRIRVFVSKWHIQAIHWFRKYITRPLSSMTENPYISKLIFAGVWALSGIWYSFSIGGAVWGLIIGASVIAENKLSKFRRIKPNGIIVTMFILALSFVFLARGNISSSLGYFAVMFGGNGNLADSFAVYLLKYYIVILLVAVYASTDLFRNTIARVKDMRFGRAVSSLAPAVLLVLLFICTAFMAYSGQSDSMIISL
ncbi:MAG: hypothetical protein IKJ87_04490 [Ruminococcus sp.]|nr:hypothetical protein [Ruminococcus sp.]